MSDVYRCDGCGQLLGENDARVRSEPYGVRAMCDPPILDWCRSCATVARRAVAAAVKQGRVG